MARVVGRRQRTCLYAHEQCLVACDQWTRVMKATLLRSTTNAFAPSRSSVDPGLAKLVQSEAACWTGRETAASFTHWTNNSAGGSGLVDGESVIEVVESVADPAKDGSQSKETNDHLSPSFRHGLTPWKDPGKCYSPGLQGLHEEIEDFYVYMRPLPEEQLMRTDIITRLSQIVMELWSSAEVKVFGSFKTDLYLPTSDIDLVVMCDDVDSQTAMKMLEQKLIERNAYDDVKVIKTSVPIVKFTDRKTAVKVDVSFNVQTGISSADFIKSMMTEYSELPFLVLVLKQFLLYRNLLESFNGGISSYCLILLIISYLQIHPEDRKTGNHGDMLIKFLELYGRHFNYLRTGIRICNGGSYFPKNENEGEMGNRFSLLCIEDPFNPANDVGQGCYGAMKVREEFDKAYRELCDAVLPQYHHIQPVGSSFLGRILLLPPEVIQYRQLIREKYRDHIAFDSLASAADDNRSDDAGSTCSQNSNLSSEQHLTKGSSSTSSSSSTSPGSSIPSETESDAQSDGTKQLIAPAPSSSHVRYVPSFESPHLESFPHLEAFPPPSDEVYHLQPLMNSTVIAVPSSTPAYLHAHQSLPLTAVAAAAAQPPQGHPPPPSSSSVMIDQAAPVSHSSHSHHTNASGRSNSWHNTSRSQGLKSSLRSSAASSSASSSAPQPTPQQQQPTSAVGSKTFVTTRYNNNGERRRKNAGRHEGNNSSSSSSMGGGGGGYVSSNR